MSDSSLTNSKCTCRKCGYKWAASRSFVRQCPRCREIWWSVSWHEAAIADATSQINRVSQLFIKETTKIAPFRQY